ncbi:MAG: flagellar assembly peptidoglycan hydrolase FlgJ, partial [Pseudomonas sp.]|nr:flagellar assembly peptidoglycan hydrolase FlgJ [Pseudomonas sp.]
MNPKSLISGASDSGAFTDLNRLSSLKAGDRDSEGNIRKVAQEFESLFVSEMLKASRKATDVMADEDSPMNSDTVKQYRDM